MKRVATINLRKSNFLGMFKKNKFIILITFLYTIGILAGTVILKKSDTLYTVANNSFLSFLNIRTDKDFLGIVLSSFTAFIPIVLFIFLSGTSVVGVVLAPLIVCYCGFSYGITAGFIYSRYTLQGIAFNSLVLIPCNLVALIGYYILIKNAFNFSLDLVRTTLPGGNTADIYKNFKLYCKRFVLVLLIFLASASLNAIMSSSVFKYFNF